MKRIGKIHMISWMGQNGRVGYDSGWLFCHVMANMINTLVGSGISPVLIGTGRVEAGEESVKLSIGTGLTACMTMAAGDREHGE